MYFLLGLQRASDLTQIVSLKLCLWLTERRSITAVRDALVRHQGTLQELKLWIHAAMGGNVAEVLAVIAGLSGLKSLSLTTLFTWPSHRDGTCELSSSLQRLGVGEGLGPGLWRSLLESSKTSLVEVIVSREAEQLLELLHQCPLLRAVTVQFNVLAKHLSSLEKVGDLQTLEVRRRGTLDLKALSDFLDSKPLLPWRLRLVCQKAATNASPAVLQRVHYLKFVNSVPPIRKLRKLLDSLQNLEELHFTASLRSRDGPWETLLWRKVAAFWTKRTAPALRDLHVHDIHGKWGPGLPELAERLETFLPELRLCLARDCPGKYPRAL